RKGWTLTWGWLLLPLVLAGQPGPAQAQEASAAGNHWFADLWLTGDQQGPANLVATAVGIDAVSAGLTPQQKLQQVQQLQSQGHVVAMVGDGINDTPVLAAANLSIAMGGAAEISQANADMVLLSNHLSVLASAVELARKTRRIIIENMSWAIAYNLIALPAAAMGWLAPWMAAIGMSLSSLIVVLNSTRLAR
ncbi:MAG: HAD-IC family P-type ATPase, partial [bacterium]